MNTRVEVLAYSIRDTGVALGGLGKTKIYELVSQGKLKARAIGGRTVIDAQSVREFYEGCPSAPIGPAGEKQATT